MAEKKKKTKSIAQIIVEHCRMHDAGALLVVLDNDCQLRIYFKDGELVYAQCQQFKGVEALKLLKEHKTKAYRFYSDATTLLECRFPPLAKIFKNVKKKAPKKEVYYPL